MNPPTAISRQLSSSNMATLEDVRFKVKVTSTLGWAGDETAQRLMQMVLYRAEILLKRRRWSVVRVEEFYPRAENLLGLNVNRGEVIQLRFRPPVKKTEREPLLVTHGFRDKNKGSRRTTVQGNAAVAESPNRIPLGPDGESTMSASVFQTMRMPANPSAIAVAKVIPRFYSFEHIMCTMLHEMVHCIIGPHNSAFWATYHELVAECEALEVELQRKGAADPQQQLPPAVTAAGRRLGEKADRDQTAELTRRSSSGEGRRLGGAPVDQRLTAAEQLRVAAVGRVSLLARALYPSTNTTEDGSGGAGGGAETQQQPDISDRCGSCRLSQLNRARAFDGGFGTVASNQSVPAHTASTPSLDDELIVQAEPSQWEADDGEEDVDEALLRQVLLRSLSETSQNDTRQTLFSPNADVCDAGDEGGHNLSPNQINNTDDRGRVNPFAHLQPTFEDDEALLKYAIEVSLRENVRNTSTKLTESAIRSDLRVGTNTFLTQRSASTAAPTVIPQTNSSAPLPPISRQTGRLLPPSSAIAPTQMPLRRVSFVEDGLTTQNLPLPVINNVPSVYTQTLPTLTPLAVTTTSSLPPALLNSNRLLPIGGSPSNTKPTNTSSLGSLSPLTLQPADGRMNDETWQCTVCTFINTSRPGAHSLNVCNICAAVRNDNVLPPGGVNNGDNSTSRTSAPLPTVSTAALTDRIATRTLPTHLPQRPAPLPVVGRTPRNTGDERPAPRDASWQCHKCTFINKERNSASCEMCGEPKLYVL